MSLDAGQDIFDPFADDGELFIEESVFQNQMASQYIAPQVANPQPQIPVTQSIVDMPIPEISEEDMDSIAKDMVFGHGPVIVNDIDPMTPEQFASLTPEESAKLQAGWRYQWEELRVTDDPNEIPTKIKYPIHNTDYV